MDGSVPAPTLEVLLRGITYEAEGVNAYILEPVGGGALPPFTAGAHVDLHLPNGITRSYSLLNDPAERGRYVIGVHHAPESRGGSRYVHEALRVGARLTIGPPRNNFPLNEDAPHSVLIAGGIGVTPLLSMATRLESLGRSWELHYACRTRARAAFLERLAALDAGRGRLHLTFDDEEGGRMLDLAALLASARPDAHLYCCGPLPMLDAFERAAQRRPAAQVHLEYFVPKSEAAVEGGYEVVLRRSGKVVPVGPGQTMLAALLNAGASVNFSCSEGVCGTCETRVLAGLPDHRDAFLTDEEKAANGTVMPCCSGSLSPRLELDL